MSLQFLSLMMTDQDEEGRGEGGGGNEKHSYLKCLIQLGEKFQLN